MDNPNMTDLTKAIKDAFATKLQNTPSQKNIESICTHTSPLARARQLGDAWATAWSGDVATAVVDHLNSSEENINKLKLTKLPTSTGTPSPANKDALIAAHKALIKAVSPDGNTITNGNAKTLLNYAHNISTYTPITSASSANPIEEKINAFINACKQNPSNLFFCSAVASDNSVTGSDTIKIPLHGLKMCNNLLYFNTTDANLDFTVGTELLDCAHYITVIPGIDETNKGICIDIHDLE